MKLDTFMNGMYRADYFLCWWPDLSTQMVFQPFFFVCVFFNKTEKYVQQSKELSAFV